MRIKVETVAKLTLAQQETLQQLGCEATPFITWPHALIFAATCNGEQAQRLRGLSYVTRVEPMPVYHAAKEG